MKIVVINQKGGVGKSTVSTNLSYALSLKNKKTLVVDVDPQAHSSIIFCDEISKQFSVNELFLTKNFEISKSIKQAIINEKKVDNLFVIPANIHLATTAEQVSAKTHREKLLHNHLKQIEEEFDYIIMDCPPTLGVLTVNAIYTADLIIIPTIYSKYSLDGVADLFNSISEVKETSDYAYMILRNMYDSRNKQSNIFIENQLDELKENVFNTIIRKSESINQAQMNEETIFTFDPKSNGVDDFKQLAVEVMGL